MTKARRENDNGRVRSYTRKFNPSAHALMRFRERVEHEYHGYSDDELGNLLDERIRGSTERQTITDVRNSGAQSLVVGLRRRDDSVYYAIIRDDTVVTVLDGAMLQSNFDNGRWKSEATHKPFNRDSLRNVTRCIVEKRLGIVHDHVERTPKPLPPVDEEAPEEPGKPDVAAASLALGEAMVAHARARSTIEHYRAKLLEMEALVHGAIATAQQAEEHVTAMQAALADAVNNATKKEPTP